jgi:hypothetical protein
MASSKPAPSPFSPAPSSKLDANRAPLPVAAPPCELPVPVFLTAARRSFLSAMAPRKEPPSLRPSLPHGKQQLAQARRLYSASSLGAPPPSSLWASSSISLLHGSSSSSHGASTYSFAQQLWRPSSLFPPSPMQQHVSSPPPSSSLSRPGNTGSRALSLVWVEQRLPCYLLPDAPSRWHPAAPPQRAPPLHCCRTSPPLPLPSSLVAQRAPPPTHAASCTPQQHAPSPRALSARRIAAASHALRRRFGLPCATMRSSSRHVCSNHDRGLIW